MQHIRKGGFLAVGFLRYRPRQKRSEINTENNIFDLFLENLNTLIKWFW